MKNRKAIIVGLSSLKLKKKEKKFLIKNKRIRSFPDMRK